MKSYRERFIKNHKQEIHIAPNKKGYRKVLVYTGDYYTWEPAKGTIRSVRRMFLLCEIVSIILFCLASIPGTAISYSRLVVTGILITFVAWVFEIFGIVPLCFKRLPLQEDDYSAVNKMFRVMPLIRCASLLFSAVTGILFLKDQGMETVSMLSITGYILTAILALGLFLAYHQLSRHKTILPGNAAG